MADQIELDFYYQHDLANCGLYFEMEANSECICHVILLLLCARNTG